MYKYLIYMCTVLVTLLKPAGGPFFPLTAPLMNCLYLSLYTLHTDRKVFKASQDPPHCTFPLRMWLEYMST